MAKHADEELARKYGLPDTMTATSASLELLIDSFGQMLEYIKSEDSDPDMVAQITKFAFEVKCMSWGIDVRSDPHRRNVVIDALAKVSKRFIDQMWDEPVVQEHLDSNYQFAANVAVFRIQGFLPEIASELSKPETFDFFVSCMKAWIGVAHTDGKQGIRKWEATRDLLQLIQLDPPSATSLKRLYIEWRKTVALLG